MELTGLHIMLTYQCALECDHCFAWGSPWQSSTMTLKTLRLALQQAQEIKTIQWIYFEGGEPFLHYTLLLKGVREAARMGFQVGVVSNAYWATDVETAVEWLKPLLGLVHSLEISNDLYHGYEDLSQNAFKAAGQVGIPAAILSVAAPEAINAEIAIGQLPPGESRLMFRGRAAEKLVERAVHHPWEQFTECPFENLRDPGRVHLDPLGYVHLCQGIALGNIFETPLHEVCQHYDPDSHPIVDLLLRKGPAGLVEHYRLSTNKTYADACHLCFLARRELRDQFPQILVPDQMYEVS